MKIYIYCLCVVLLTSCLKVEESIEPFVEAKNLSQVQKEMFLRLANQGMSDDLSTHQPKYSYDESKPDVFYLKLDYNFLNIDMNTLSGGDGNFEILANKFVLFFAKAFFRMGGTFNVDFEELNLDIPDLGVDRNLISAIYINNVKMQYSNRIRHSYGTDANFKFINSFEITAPYTVPGTSNQMDLLLFGYDQSKNECDYYCIDFDIYTYDVLDLIGESTSLKINPELIVQDVPIADMEFTGTIEVVIELRLPF